MKARFFFFIAFADGSSGRTFARLVNARRVCARLRKEGFAASIIRRDPGRPDTVIA